MSQLIGAAQTNPWIVNDYTDDPRTPMRVEVPAHAGILRVDIDAPRGSKAQEARMVQPFLPSSFFGAPIVDIAVLDPPVWVLPPPLPGGTSARLGFNGFTRDASGGVIPAVTVKCFLTADDTKQSETVSDQNGFFTVSTPFSGGHYLIFYKTGTPDISGTTVNTLQGA